MTRLMRFGLGAPVGGYRVEWKLIEPAASTRITRRETSAFHPHGTMPDALVLRTLVVQRTRPQEDGEPISATDHPDRCSPHRTNRGAAWLTDRPFSAWRPIPTRTPRWPTSARCGESTTTASPVTWPPPSSSRGSTASCTWTATTRRRLDLAWGGALIGGALAVVAAPLAIAPLSVVATQDGDAGPGSAASSGTSGTTSRSANCSG